MKIVTYETAGGSPRAGLLENNRVYDLGTNTRALLNGGPEARQKAAQAARSSAGAALSDVTLRAPLRHPGKILALAGNYRAHRQEGATPVADSPLPEIFCKPVTSVIGPDEAIKIPGPPVAGTDYEGELGVVIGKHCLHVSEQDAYAYIGGYLCLNDVSGRKLDPGFERPAELAARAKFFDWLIGKWPDTFCPIGPYLVTADEVKDPMNLTLVTRVNGEERQRTNTSEMIHSIARTIAYCSQFMTLEPGDIIATGTPAGVGYAMEPPHFLASGDRVTAEVEGIGSLENTIA
jgi:2,4-diketo-3-deoxy-L-fuconate hydrolase